MRLILAAVLSTIAFTSISSVSPASAQGYDPYPWCAEYGAARGATNCYFKTLYQCNAAISGNGGSCRRNLFYTGNQYDEFVHEGRPHRRGYR